MPCQIVQMVEVCQMSVRRCQVVYGGYWAIPCEMVKIVQMVSDVAIML